MSLGRVLLGIAAVAVLGALVASVLVMESPAQQRERRLDQRRADELRALSQAMDRWAINHEALPASLSELAASQPGVATAIKDPESGMPYGFEALGRTGYRLCATFATSTAERGDSRSWVDKDWLHPAGEYCFERSALLMAPGSRAR